MKRVNCIILVILTVMLLASCGKESKGLEENSVGDLNPVAEAEEQNDYQNIKDDAGEIEIPEGYVVVDYEELAGAEYDFYLFADNFLRELSDFLAERSDDIDVFAGYIDQGKDVESVSAFISGLRESGAKIRGYYFLRQDNGSVSFNDFQEIPVIIEFVYENQTRKKEIELLFIQKTIDGEDIFWRLENIEPWIEEEIDEIEEAEGEEEAEEAEKAEEAEEEKEVEEEKEKMEEEMKEEEADSEDEQPESPKEVDNSRWDWFIKPGEYSNIKLYDENFIAVSDSSGKYGFLDGDKNLIVECQYMNVLGVSEQIARVVDWDQNYLFLDYSGKMISEETFQDANDFSEGLAAVEKGEKWGFINTSGRIAIACQYDNVTEFREGLAAVEIDGNWHYIDQRGKSVFEEVYEDALYFSEGLAAVKKDGKWGFIDKNGNLKIDFQYEDAGNFSEGKAAVANTIDGYQKWAYINANNEVVIDYKLYSATEGRLVLVGEFQDGYALVTSDLYCLINEEGKKVLGNNSCFLTGGSTYSIEPGWMAAYDYTDDSMTEEKYGFVDINGRIKVPYIFEHVSEIHGDLAAVRYEQGGKAEAGVIRLNLRSYDSHREFPYGNMEFVDEKTYAFLKKTYEEIDFAGEFQIGNLDIYDEYKEEFKKMLNNEITFTELETGEEYYVNEYTGLKSYGDEEFDPGEFRYYLFDMDGDDTPELCIWDGETYIFKYYSDFGEMALWLEIPSPNEQIHGTKVLDWNWEGVRYSLSRMDERGEYVFWVYFLEEASWSNGIVTYMVALPFYEGKQMEMPKEMEKQGYFSEEDGLYLYQVTEEQFDELTRDYFDACKWSEKEKEKVTFTYDELFGTEVTSAEIENSLIDWTWTETAEENEEARHKSYGRMDVSVERTSRMITNGEGEILAEVYYDRPVVSENSWAARRINQFFEQEERKWLTGEGQNTLHGVENYLSFYAQFNDLCELFGEDRIAKNPSRYTMSTRIMYLDNELLSILQMASVENMMHTSCYYYGRTYDLKSGELVSITELIDIDADKLGRIIKNVLPEEDIYDEVGGNNYLIHYYEDEIAMDYEYYYDGENFYIILNHTKNGESCIVKWNGK